MFKRTRFHLRRLSRRTLNDLHKTGHPLPERSALAAALAAYVHTELRQFIRFQEPGEPRPGREGFRWLDGEDAVSRVAASAAKYALRKWNANYIEAQMERGTRGGKKSKRPRSWTRSDLEALALLEGWAVAEQAAATGRSPRTIERMRKALRDQNPSPANFEDQAVDTTQ